MGFERENRSVGVHLTCAAISAFSKCPYFSLILRFVASNNFFSVFFRFSYGKKFQNFLRKKLREKVLIDALRVAFFTVNLTQPKESKPNICRNSLEGMKKKKWKKKRVMKNRGKSSSLSSLLPTLCLVRPSVVSSLVSRDVNLINFLISQISSLKILLCVISRMDGCAS